MACRWYGPSGVLLTALTMMEFVVQESSPHPFAISAAIMWYLPASSWITDPPQDVVVFTSEGGGYAASIAFGATRRSVEQSAPPHAGSHTQPPGAHTPFIWQSNAVAHALVEPAAATKPTRVTNPTPRARKTMTPIL